MFKCNLCDESFEGRAEFLVHKKQFHSKFVPDCEKFSLGKCSRGNECWFVHKSPEHSSTPNSSNESSSASVFQKDRISLPPDSVGKMVELMEKLNLTMQTLAQSLTSHTSIQMGPAEFWARTVPMDPMIIPLQIFIVNVVYNIILYQL